MARKASSDAATASLPPSGAASVSITASNTPTPPGTWLKTTATQPNRYTPRNCQNPSGSFSGSNTYKQAAATIRSAAETANCAIVMPRLGSLISMPRKRIGSVRIATASKYTAVIPSKIQPTG